MQRILWSNPATKPAFIVDAVKVRRRISAEAMRIRAYLNEMLSNDLNASVVVCGDFNDGPGTDFFERLYLTHNLVAAIAGNPFNPLFMLIHGFVDRMNRDENYTSIFDDFIDNINNRRILLDHIQASPALYWDLNDDRIDHNAFDASVDNAKPGHREKLPIDHRPQWIEY